MKPATPGLLRGPGDRRRRSASATRCRCVRIRRTPLPPRCPASSSQRPLRHRGGPGPGGAGLLGAGRGGVRAAVRRGGATHHGGRRRHPDRGRGHPWLTATVARSQTYAGASRRRSSSGRGPAVPTDASAPGRPGRALRLRLRRTRVRRGAAAGSRCRATTPTCGRPAQATRPARPGRTGPSGRTRSTSYGSVGPRGGKAALYVDGGYVTTVDTYAPTVGRRRLLATTNVAWGRHGFRLLAQGTTARPRSSWTPSSWAGDPTTES